MGKKYRFSLKYISGEFKEYNDIVYEKDIESLKEEIFKSGWFQLKTNVLVNLNNVEYFVIEEQK